MVKQITAALLVFIITHATAQNNSYQKDIEAWHQKREADLKKENGWLNLVGLIWLQEGKNSFGDGDKVQIKFPKGSITKDAGYFELHGGVVTLHANASTAITINGVLIKDAVIFHPDSTGRPVICSYGNLRWTIIKRDDKIGIRLRDVKSDLVRNFTTIPYYTIDSSFKVSAYLKTSADNYSISIKNVIGQTNQEKTPGKLVFKLHGTEYTLDALEEGNQLFVIFGDATSGKETYPAGRFLYAAKPDTNGYTVLDFNKAYNPPCAFTPYATCPIPPPQNILPIAITVGEKNYGQH